LVDVKHNSSISYTTPFFFDKKAQKTQHESFMLPPGSKNHPYWALPQILPYFWWKVASDKGRRQMKKGWIIDIDNVKSLKEIEDYFDERIRGKHTSSKYKVIFEELEKWFKSEAKYCKCGESCCEKINATRIANLIISKRTKLARAVLIQERDISDEETHYTQGVSTSGPMNPIQKDAAEMSRWGWSYDNGQYLEGQFGG